MDPVTIAVLGGLGYMLLAGRGAKRVSYGGRVTLLEGQQLSDRVMSFLNRVSLRAGTPLIVTSGRRTPARQASAMLYKLHNRGGAEELRRLYGRNGDLIEELLASGDDEGTWASIITDQVHRGRYLSSHMVDGAADLRSRDWTTEQRKAVEDAVRKEGGRPVFEGDHLHIEAPK